MLGVKKVRSNMSCVWGAARRKYSAAIETFMIAMTAPMYQVNAIAVAAWKKYVLVSLIHTGMFLSRHQVKQNKEGLHLNQP